MDEETVSIALARIRRSVEDIRVAMDLPAPEVQSPALMATAARLREERRLRTRLLPAALRAERAWDLLLVLFLAREEGQEIGTSATFSAAGLSDASGQRWLNKLERAGFIARRPSEEKKSATVVKLTDLGLTKVSELLSRMR